MHFTLGGAHKGAGDTITPLIGALIGNWGIRVPVAILIAGVFELDVVWIWATLILDHISRALWLGFSFVRGRWSELPDDLHRDEDHRDEDHRAEDHRAEDHRAGSS